MYEGIKDPYIRTARIYNRYSVADCSCAVNVCRMKCPKTGFTPMKIISLVVTGGALVVHIAAVAYPVWDEIDTAWRGPKGSLSISNSKKIQASGSLFDFTMVVDESKNFFPPDPSQIDKSMYILIHF